jgi:hypothetical protein
MKEDILEQLVDDYLQLRGYFTRHNIKFRPEADTDGFVRNKDSNHSDIDVIGFNPNLADPERIWVVSCKSWQAGFRVASKVAELEGNKVRSGRAAWKGFRELMIPKWTEAFLRTVQRETGTTAFTYVTAVTAIHGNSTVWERNPRFREALKGNPIKLLSLEEILAEVLVALSTTVASSNLARMLQLLKASGGLGRLRNGASLELGPSKSEIVDSE